MSNGGLVDNEVAAAVVEMSQDIVAFLLREVIAGNPIEDKAIMLSRLLGHLETLEAYVKQKMAVQS